MIVLNGEPHEGAATLAELLECLSLPRRGVAVALDGEVVPRGDWQRVELSPGARVEVVSAVCGG